MCPGEAKRDYSADSSKKIIASALPVKTIKIKIKKKIVIVVVVDAGRRMERTGTVLTGVLPGWISNVYSTIHMHRVLRPVQLAAV